MKKKTAKKKVAKKKWAKQTGRSEGNTVMSLSCHKTLVIASYFAAKFEGKDRSPWMAELAVKRINEMKEMPQYAKLLEGVDVNFDLNSASWILNLPQEMVETYEKKQK